LSASLSDPHRFDDLPAEVRKIVSVDIAAVAKSRGADIQRLDQKIQSLEESLALSVTELTASVQGSAAGIRETTWAWASAQRASAGQITQIQARLDNFSGGAPGTATVESKMTAIADRATGLEAQIVFKVATNGAAAGLGIAATTDTSGNSTSAIIMQADKVAFVSPSDTISNPLSPSVNRIPFGVDLTNDTIYINGAVRINSGGTRLDQLGKAVVLSSSTQVFKQSTTGTWDATSITVTASKSGGLSGSVVWSVVSGTYTGSLTGTGGTGTASGSLSVARASMTTQQVTFRASVTDSGQTFTDDITIVQLVDGSSTITGFLTNEATAVPASPGGVVTDFSSASGSFKVFQGATDVTASATFSITSNPNTLTASINASGNYSVTAAGSWSSSSSTTSITFRAAYSGVNVDKVFVLSKALQGLAGNNGGRGTQNGYGSLFSIYLQGTNDSADPWPLTGTSAQTANAFKANAVISNMLTGGSLTSLSSTAGLIIGDQVTLTDSATPTKAETRVWNGFNWVKPGTVINGSLIVTGTVSASALTAGVATGARGSVELLSFSTLLKVTRTGSTTIPAVYISENDGIDYGTELAYFKGGNSNSAIATVHMESHQASALGLLCDSFGTTSGSAKFRNYAGSTTTTSKEFWAAPGAYAAYSPAGKGKYYFPDGAGPFTAFHQGFIARGEYELGDILVDDTLIDRQDISNAIFSLAVSSSAKQDGVTGIVSEVRDLSVYSPDLCRRDLWILYHETHDLVDANALGEGLINVCGEAGDIARGDLIVTSSTPGKGMRQLTDDGAPDNTVRSYTVAEAREAVTFDDPSQVKQIACRYRR
jgi:hypothetical protein